MKDLKQFIKTTIREFLNEGDIVYCKVKGNFYTHLVKGKNNEKGLLIGNNKGGINGWTKQVYGRVGQTFSRMKHILTLVFIINSYLAVSQKVYFVPYEHQANIIIYVTNNKYEATNIIRVVKQKDQAINNKWYICNQKDQADFSIYVTNYKWKASKIIYFEQW